MNCVPVAAAAVFALGRRCRRLQPRLGRLGQVGLVPQAVLGVGGLGRVQPVDLSRPRILEVDLVVVVDVLLVLERLLAAGLIRPAVKKT